MRLYPHVRVHRWYISVCFQTVTIETKAMVEIRAAESWNTWTATINSTLWLWPTNTTTKLLRCEIVYNRMACDKITDNSERVGLTSFYCELLRPINLAISLLWLRSIHFGSGLWAVLCLTSSDRAESFLASSNGHCCRTRLYHTLNRVCVMRLSPWFAASDVRAGANLGRFLTPPPSMLWGKRD